MTGFRREIASSMARVTFSPTTTPMLPPMKLYSIAAITVSIPSSRPVAVTTASFMPLDAWLARRRSRYALVSVKTRGSVEARFSSCTWNSPSNRVRSRSMADSRK